MVEELKRARTLISERLDEHFRRFGKDLSGVNSWGPDVAGRVLDYSLRGKMIRGGLVLLGAEAFSATEAALSENGAGRTDVLDAGCAMELIQSFLLIHDDIMDDDDTRRGAPSVHAQYRDGGAGWGVTGVEAAPAFGRSMGICAGDVTLLLAQQLVAGLSVEESTYRRINELIAREIAFVGVAQMNDLYFGYLQDSVDQEAVYRLYRYKTGRYTFSLPLALGAIFAGVSAEGVEELIQFGEEVGVVFQIIDDDIGLFGETEKTGKPVGSDIQANKKTLHRHYLLEAVRERPAQAGEREELHELFGAVDLDRSQVERIRERMVTSGAHDRVTALLREHADRAREIADGFAARYPASESAGAVRGFLNGLIDYNLKRQY